VEALTGCSQIGKIGFPEDRLLHTMRPEAAHRQQIDVNGQAGFLPECE
jgi:hypothetical protein